MYITDLGARNMVFRSHQARYGQSTQRSSSKQPAGRSQAVASAFATRIGELKAEFANLKDLVAEAKLGSTRSKAGFARSDAPISGLNPDSIASHIRSTEEINTTPTSVSDRAPAVQRWTLTGWQAGNSTSQASIGGTYTGSTDSRFQVYTRTNVNMDGSSGRLSFKVLKDSVEVASYRIDNVDYDNGTELDIGDGLSVSFSGGQIRSGESFFFDASTSVGTDLDPTKAFNGTGADDPGLSPDAQIVDGSVKINGVEVQVNAADSLDDFMARVNSSAAGVEASFDATTDTITFSRTDAGSEDITFTDDSSGVVAALKLDSATTTPGQEADRQRTMDEVTALAGITTGTLTINGVDIAIDTSVDTLDDVLNRINSSDAGVQASYSDTTGALSIANQTTSADLVVGGDSSGLLSRFNVAEGTYASTRRRGISADKAQALTEAMTRVVTELNDIYAKLGGSDAVGTVGSTQNTLRRNLQSFVGASGRTQLGMRFQFSGEGPVVDFDEAAQRKFRAALSSNGSGVEGFLEGKGTKDGLLDILEQQMGAAESALAAEFGSGILVSASA
jgi:hypothetical protein